MKDPAASQTRSGDSRRKTRSERAPKRIRSAGGVLYSDDQVVLIATGRTERWQLPKGRIERGESPAQAARREVWEETGVDGIVLEPLQTIEFTYRQRSGRTVVKTVEYFLQRYDRGSVEDFDPVEVVRAAWFDWEEAGRVLNFDNEKRVLHTAHQRWLRQRQRQRQQRRDSQNEDPRSDEL